MVDRTQRGRRSWDSGADQADVVDGFDTAGGSDRRREQDFEVPVLRPGARASATLDQTIGSPDETGAAPGAVSALPGWTVGDASSGDGCGSDTRAGSIAGRRPRSLRDRRRSRRRRSCSSSLSTAQSRAARKSAPQASACTVRPVPRPVIATGGTSWTGGGSPRGRTRPRTGSPYRCSVRDVPGCHGRASNRDCASPRRGQRG